ncbi:MAG: MlaC/ttg2D family ABC transporter substrate-binding protein [Gammaproteobacteria bacterium]
MNGVNRVRALCSSLLLLVLLAANAADEAPTLPDQALRSPTAAVREAVDRIIVILQRKDAREAKWVEIGAIIDAHFDFRSMSQSVLATNWQAATKEEKRQFVEYFSQYLEDTYRTKIEAYTNQRVEYGAETITGLRATVNTFIVTDANRIPVNYKLRKNADDWYAYDVVIEGVSLVNNYRNTFDAIVQSEGMPGLLRDLEGRIAAHRKAHRGAREESN